MSDGAEQASEDEMRLRRLRASQAAFDREVTEAVDLVRHHPGVEHIWLNALSCIDPTDEFAAQVGREVIAKVMAHGAHGELDPLRRRHIVLRINAS